MGKWYYICMDPTTSSTFFEDKPCDQIKTANLIYVNVIYSKIFLIGEVVKIRKLHEASRY